MADRGRQVARKQADRASGALPALGSTRSLELQQHQHARRNQADQFNARRSLSSLPPEVISEVLSFLPPDDLLSCALLSTDFAALSTHPTLWARHALEAWDPERRLPSENYHAYFIRRKRRDGSASTLVEEMGKAATGNLGRLEGIRELGADVMEAVKRETAVRETDDSENWLSRRYWARQAYEMLVRAKAVEWWKTILAMDVEGETSFEEGVSCFAAYRGVDPSQVRSFRRA